MADTKKKHVVFRVKDGSASPIGSARETTAPASSSAPSASSTAASKKVPPKLLLGDETAEVYCVRHSNDGRLIAAGAGDGTVRVYNALSGDLAFRLVPPEPKSLPVTSLRWRPDARAGANKHVLLVAGSDGTVRHWHVPSSKCLSTITEKANQVFCVAQGTLVSLGDGTSVPIEKVRANTAVQSYSDKLQYPGVHGASKAATDAIANGERDCILVRLVDGTELSVTPDHRVLAYSLGDEVPQWIEAGDIVPGKHSVVCSALGTVADWCGKDELGWRTGNWDAEKHRQQTVALARLLGALLASPNSSRSAVLHFGNYLDYEAALRDVKLACPQSPVLTAYGRYGIDMMLPDELVAALQEPANGALPDCDFAPEFIGSAPAAVRREFIGALWGASGTVPSVAGTDVNGNSQAGEGIAFTHEIDVANRTSDDVAVHRRSSQRLARMLSDLGVASETTDSVTGCCHVVQVVVNAESFGRFAESVGVRYCADKSANLEVFRRWQRRRLASPTTTATLPEFAESVGFSHGTGDVPVTALRVPVAAVCQGLRRCAVYDLTVPGDSNFVAAGCVVHNCTDYRADSEKFATAGKDAKIRVYDDQTKACELVMQGGSGETAGHSSRIFSMKFNPMDPNVIVSGGWDNTIQFYDCRAGHAVRSIFGPHVCGDSVDVRENTILTGSWRPKDALQLWDSGTGLPILSVDVKSPSGEPCLVYAAQYSRHGQFIALAGSGSNEARIMRPSGQFVTEIRGFEKGIFSLDFAPDESSLAIAGPGTLRVYETRIAPSTTGM